MSVLYDECLTCWVYYHIFYIAVSLSCLILWVNEVVSLACVLYDECLTCWVYYHILDIAVSLLFDTVGQ